MHVLPVMAAHVHPERQRLVFQIQTLRGIAVKPYGMKFANEIMA